MTTTKEMVQGMQTDVLTNVESVFTEMKSAYGAAMASALSEVVGTGIAFSPNISEPGDPSPRLDMTKMIEYLDGLRGLFLNRPNYPTYDYNSGLPQLPSLDTTPPDLTVVTLPPEMTLNIPTFDAELEDETVTLPDVEFDFSEVGYTSALHDALYSLLWGEVLNGNYGINDNDETRLFERAREREQAAMNTAVDNAVRLFSSGGFSAPTGSAMAAMQRIQDEASGKISTLSRDIMLERSKLYLEGKKMNEEHTLSLEKQDSDLHNAKQERALKVAAQRVTSILEIASFQLERLKLFMEKYKTLAYVFETRVKAELGKAEIYKTQMDGAKLQVELNMALLEEFTARNKAIVDVFLAEVEEYKAKLSGYVAYVGALADQYKADAAAFAAMVDGYGKSFTYESDALDAIARYKVGLLEARTALEKIEADIATTNGTLEMQGLVAQVSAAAGVASAALGAMNVNASVGADANTSAAYQYQVQVSTDTSY